MMSPLTAAGPRPAKTVLAIAGSLRQGSYNRLLLNAAAVRAPADMHIDVYSELAAIPLFSEDLEQESRGGPEAVRRLRAKVAAADGLLISTPEYNQSLPGVLKNTIDWLSRAAPDEVLAGKSVAVIGATTGRWGTRLAQAALRQTLAAAEAHVMPAPTLYAAQAEVLFDASGCLLDAAVRASLAAVLTSFENWIERTSAPIRLTAVG